MSGQARVQDIASKLNLVLTEIMVSVQFLDLGCRRQKLNEIIEQLNTEEFLHESVQQKILLHKGILTSRKLYLALIILLAFDFLVHVFFIPAWNGFKILPADMNFLIFDINESSIFPYVYVYQVLYKVWMVPVYISLQTLRWSFMLSAITQLDIFIFNVKDINIHDKGEDFQHRFKKSIQHHCAIIRLVNNIENVFGGQLLLFFILNACVMCTMMLEGVKLTKNLFDVLWVFGFLFTMALMLYVDCYFGSAIEEKSAQLSSVMYCYPWMVLPRSLKMNFIIANSQRPLMIKAGNLIPVSIQSFTKVMNWTYQGFAVINQMKN